jgi:hypothetical protein
MKTATKYLVILLMLLIWLLVYYAKILDYDENYACFMQAVLLSTLVTITIVLFLKYKKEFFYEHWLIFIVFLITSSPFSLIIFVQLYFNFIGYYFKVH